MRYFITGAAGFIGFHLAGRLLDDGHQVLGLDGMTEYYDVSLKRRRLSTLLSDGRFSFVECMLEDVEAWEQIARDFQPDVIVHLAAQAGVRYSLENPAAYITANIDGTFKLLEFSRSAPPKHLMIASTSSVYGGNERQPFAEVDRTDFPVSLYAATKKACEAMSHSYAHLFGIPTTCFRFFTVYGPWGRPDMALFKFVERIERGDPIELYGHGEMHRDFTYIDDLVEAMVRLSIVPPEMGFPVEGEQIQDSLSPVAPWRTVNIAGSNPTDLSTFVSLVERALGKQADVNLLPMQPGDVVSTHADSSLMTALVGYQPTTPVAEGVQSFIDWYREIEYATN